MSAYYNGKKVDITYTSDMNVETLRNMSANAITDTKSGISALRIDGLSPLANRIKVTLEAVNLIDQTEFFASNRYTITGEVGKTYTIGCTFKSGVTSGGYIADVDGNGGLITSAFHEDVTEYVITIEEGHTYTWNTDGANASDIYESVYMVLADVSGVGIKSYGKNLFLTANPRRASNTVTVTDNVIRWYGDYYFIVPVHIPKGVPFTWSYSKLENDGTSTFLRVTKRYTDGTGDSGTSQDKTQIPEKDMSELWVYKSVAAELNTSVITDFQIEIDSSVTEYEFGKQPVDGIEVIIPTTTLISDTSGVKITAEYSKDTNKVIQELKNAILNLGGTI